MISVLMYHQVARDLHHDDSLTITPHRFEQQMAYLHQEGYQCLSFEKAVTFWRKGLPQPKKSFVLTFDDGYQDIYSTVYPILQQYAFTATVFLVTERVGSHSSWKGQRGVPLLSWAEIRELSNLKMSFGSHTLTHPKLPSLDIEHATREIERSKLMIEEHLGLTVDLFSYPYGASTSHIQRIVAASGYTAACGVERGTWNLFNTWRVQCDNNDTMKSFGWKVNGWYRPRIWLREQSILGPPLRYAAQCIRRLMNRSRR